MRCDKVIEELSALLDGELNAADTAEARAHLDACPACRREFETLRETVRSVQALEHVAAPKDFRRDVMASIEAESRPAESVSRWRVWWPAAAAVIIAGIILVLYPNEGRRPIARGTDAEPVGLARSYVVAKADDETGKREAAGGQAALVAPSAPTPVITADERKDRAPVDKAAADAGSSLKAAKAPSALADGDVPREKGTAAKEETYFAASKAPPAPAAESVPAAHEMKNAPLPQAGVEFAIRAEDPAAARTTAQALLAKRGWTSGPSSRLQEGSGSKSAGQFDVNAPIILNLTAVEVAALAGDLQRAGLIAPAPVVAKRLDEPKAGVARRETRDAVPGPAVSTAKAKAAPIPAVRERVETESKPADPLLRVTINFLPLKANRAP